MYSLVLMTAMAGAPDTPEFNGYFRDLFSPRAGCNGCSGGARYSCGGGSADYYAGCTGCTGCTGHGFLGIRDWWQSRSLSGGGCCGGSSARAMSYGCCGGSSYSCMGGPVMAYNPQFNAGLSCMGGPVPFAPAPDFGSPFIQPGGSIPYAQPDVAPPSVIPDSRSFQRNDKNGVVTVSGSGPTDGERATVVVRLPADATLFADGSPLRQSGAERKFVSPPLPAGRDFTYQFKVEYDRNGETLSVTKRVLVRAGGSVLVEFADLTAAKPNVDAKSPTTSPATNPNPPMVTGTTVSNTTSEKNATAEPPVTTPTTGGADQRAVILVKLPAGAKLTVDGRECPTTGSVRQFTTPPLPAGKEFAYLMKAEVVKNGQSEFALIQKVHFRGGDQVTVDFTAGK